MWKTRTPKSDAMWAMRHCQCEVNHGMEASDEEEEKGGGMKARIMGRSVELPDDRMVNTSSAILLPSTRSAFRSKLEEAYSRYLHGLLLAGDISQYRYEPLRFQLAPNTTITPDFQVILPNGKMEFREVKGYAREDAMAKLKICARLYPEWKFWLVKRKRGVWEHKELPV